MHASAHISRRCAQGVRGTKQFQVIIRADICYEPDLPTLLHNEMLERLRDVCSVLTCL
jgi:hypothetical protein